MNALFSGINVPVATMLFNSLIMAIGIAVGKIVISLLSAFAVVYFRFPGKMFFFWLIFWTLMLPVSESSEAFTISLPGVHHAKPGEVIAFRLNPENLHFFDPNSGARIG